MDSNEPKYPSGQSYVDAEPVEPSFHGLSRISKDSRFHDFDAESRDKKKSQGPKNPDDPGDVSRLSVAFRVLNSIGSVAVGLYKSVNAELAYSTTVDICLSIYRCNDSHIDCGARLRPVARSSNNELISAYRSAKAFRLGSTFVVQKFAVGFFFLWRFRLSLSSASYRGPSCAHSAAVLSYFYLALNARSLS